MSLDIRRGLCPLLERVLGGKMHAYSVANFATVLASTLPGCLCNSGSIRESGKGAHSMCGEEREDPSDTTNWVELEVRNGRFGREGVSDKDEKESGVGPEKIVWR